MREPGAASWAQPARRSQLGAAVSHARARYQAIPSLRILGLAPLPARLPRSPPRVCVCVCVCVCVGGAVYRLFDAYAAFDVKSGVSGVTYNGFKDFVQDADLDEPGSKYCDSADYDRLFIQINSKLAGGGAARKGRKGGDIELTLEMVGQFGMAVGGGADVSDADKRSLCRHEWINCLVRVAIMRYVLPGKVKDVSGAIEHLLKMDVEPKLEAWILSDTDAFRRDVCYTEAVDAVLCEHESSLRNVLEFYYDSESREQKSERRTMSLDEWLTMLKTLRLLDDHVTLRDANWVFVLSRMRVVDEMGGKRAELKLENLSLEDCYEAIVRFACIKALPTVSEPPPEAGSESDGSRRGGALQSETRGARLCAWQPARLAHSCFMCVRVCICAPPLPHPCPPLLSSAPLCPPLPVGCLCRRCPRCFPVRTRRSRRRAAATAATSCCGCASRAGRTSGSMRAMRGEIRWRRPYGSRQPIGNPPPLLLLPVCA